MSEDTPVETETNADAPKADVVTFELSGSSFDGLVKLVKEIYEDGPKGLEGNKQAARRSRKALNELKKACTPLRISIQDAVKPKAAE